VALIEQSSEINYAVAAADQQNGAEHDVGVVEDFLCELLHHLVREEGQR